MIVWSVTYETCFLQTKRNFHEIERGSSSIYSHIQYSNSVFTQVICIGIIEGIFREHFSINPQACLSHQVQKHISKRWRGIWPNEYMGFVRNMVSYKNFSYIEHNCHHLRYVGGILKPIFYQSGS